MTNWLLFKNPVGLRLVTWLETRLNLAIVTNPHLHLVDAQLLSQAPIPYWPIRNPFLPEDPETERRNAAEQ